MKRPIQITVAAFLQVVLGIVGIVVALPILQLGASSATGDGPPFMIMAVGFATAVLSLVSGYGLWQNQRWGKVLAIMVRAVDGLSALPGLFFSPTTGLFIMALIGVALSLVVIVLVLWRTPHMTPARS